MPKLYPDPLSDTVRKNSKLAGEMQVYDALAKKLPDEYFVFHSVAWLVKGRREGAYDGEADFVIAHPDQGVLVLEVKGGRVITHNAETDTWTSESFGGHINTIDDPFKQVVNNKHNLFRKLEEHSFFKGKQFTVGHAVCFPGIEKGGVALGPNGPLDFVLDRDDLSVADRVVPHILAAFRKEKHVSLGLSGMDALRNLLARSFTLKTPLGRILDEERQQLVELTEDQFDMLDFVGQHRRAAIHGAAGTGKTLMALEKARRLAAEGFRTLLTCYNIPLEHYLQQHVGAVENLTIRRFHGFCVDAAKATGIPVAEHPPDHPDSDYWQRVLPEALQAAMDAGLTPYDAIVVDEAQDFPDAFWLPLQCGLADSEHSPLYVFMDAAQRIYGAESSLIAELPRFDLTKNVRNTQHIHRFAQAFAERQGIKGGATLKAKGPEGRPVEIHALPAGGAKGRDLEKALAGIVSRLAVQEKVAPEDIAILTGRKPESLGLERQGKLAALPLTTSDAPRKGHLTLDTIHRFKGLDAPVVILTGLEGMFAETAASLLYVGLTRASSHLILLEAPEVLGKWGVSSR